MALREASRSGPGYIRHASDPLVVGSGHELALAPLLVLLVVGVVGGAFVDVLVPLCLALGVVKNCPDRPLARGMAGGDVEELLGGSRALTSQLVDQGLIGGPRQESSYDIDISDVGQLVALLGEAPDVPTKSFTRLLSVILEIPRRSLLGPPNFGFGWAEGVPTTFVPNRPGTMEGCR